MVVMMRTCSRVVELLLLLLQCFFTAFEKAKDPGSTGRAGFFLLPHAISFVSLLISGFGFLRFCLTCPKCVLLCLLLCLFLFLQSNLGIPLLWLVSLLLQDHLCFFSVFARSLRSQSSVFRSSLDRSRVTSLQCVSFTFGRNNNSLIHCIYFGR